jgi:hypothetical protein
LTIVRVFDCWRLAGSRPKYLADAELLELAAVDGDGDDGDEVDAAEADAADSDELLEPAELQAARASPPATMAATIRTAL